MSDNKAPRLRVNGVLYSADQLSGAERRAFRRIVRTELWDEELDGPFEDRVVMLSCDACGGEVIYRIPPWQRVDDDDMLTATALVFMRRTNPKATLDDALALTQGELLEDGEPESVAPPTKPSAPSSRRKKPTSAKPGTRS